MPSSKRRKHLQYLRLALLLGRLQARSLAASSEAPSEPGENDDDDEESDLAEAQLK